MPFGPTPACRSRRYTRGVSFLAPGVAPHAPAEPSEETPGPAGPRPGAVDTALAVIAAGIAAALVWLCFRFTADDAFIYMRYGANLVQRGQLVFNAGEWVSTMTSPAMALVYAALDAVTGRPRLVYKLLALLLLALTARLAWRSGGGDRRLSLAVLGVAVLSPCVVVWTLGGMATPMLMALATGLAALATRDRRTTFATNAATCALAGLGFLIRYDSVLYTAPIALACLRRERGPRRVLAGLLLAAVPVAWLSVALRLYGDVLPTSFYVKTPSLEPDTVATNAVYVSEYLVITGLVPLVLFLATARGGALRLARGVRVLWAPWTGLALMLAYGLTSATTHMMFAFRYFVPYLPGAAMLVAAAWRRGAGPAEPDARTQSRGFVVLLGALLVSQAAQGAYTVFHSVNGVVSVGELRSTSVRDLATGIDRSEELAGLIRTHWEGLGRADETPTIATFAEGALPYAYLGARVYGGLVSYRRDCPWRGPYPAHYSIVVLPASLPGGPGVSHDEKGRVLLRTEPFQLGGRRVALGARFDPSAEPARLPPRVRGPCVDPRQGG